MTAVQPAREPLLLTTRLLAYDVATQNLMLPPALELFAIEAVASRRFGDVDEVIRTGVDLVRRRDIPRVAFMASLEAIQREGAENGLHDLNDVLAELDCIIAEEEHPKA